MKTIHLITAARPNFMKIAPLYHALKNEDWAEPQIIHTGQHYDLNMSDVFFQDLKLPEPGIHLGVGSGSHAKQTGEVMIAYEKVLQKERPDMVIVVGDVNSTVAVTLASVKLGVRTAHLESGLRSFDRTMPEEINRLVTDSLADLLWTPSPDADENLLREGILPERIHRVGNIMIDSLEMFRNKILKQEVHRVFGFSPKEYGMVTLHRPSNVDSVKKLNSLCSLLITISEKIPLIFPMHPRTLKNIEKNGLMTILKKAHGLHIIEPLRYIRFMSLVFNCKFIITDSGGIQEETTYLGIPCLTLRPNTERPITIQQGTNRLCTIENLETRLERILSEKKAAPRVPDLWDGKTSGRVTQSIKNVLDG